MEPRPLDHHRYRMNPTITGSPSGAVTCRELNRSAIQFNLYCEERVCRTQRSQPDRRGFVRAVCPAGFPSPGMFCDSGVTRWAS
jgi:hypothetical protein